MKRGVAVRILSCCLLGVKGRPVVARLSASNNLFGIRARAHHVCFLDASIVSTQTYLFNGNTARATSHDTVCLSTSPYYSKVECPESFFMEEASYPRPSLSMDQGAGQDVQPHALYREDAIRRVLRVVDEAGGSMTSVHMQNAALQGILESETFWHAKRNGTFVEYDLQKLRELAARVTRDGRLTPTTGEDRVAMLFRVQSRGLPSDMLLKWQYELNKVPLEQDGCRTPRNVPAAEFLGHQHQVSFRGSAFSPTHIENFAIASRPQSMMESTERDNLATAHKTNSRGLKRKANTGTEESSLSDASLLSTLQRKSPVVCPTPRGSEKARATHMSNAMRLDKPRKLSPKDVIQQLRCIRDLQLIQVQWMVGYFKLPRTVTLTPEPNQPLAALYRRCWGDEWRPDGDLLLRQDKRSVFNDAMALISSFLLDNVFAAATPATAANLQNHPDSSAQLLAIRTELLQTKLIAALGPFFSALLHLTREMYSTPSSGALLDPKFQHFETCLAEIVTKTVALKADLDGSDLRPTFVWPENGELYDGDRMQTAHLVDPGLADTYTVAYTTFPGVLMPRSGNSMGFTAFKAGVVLQVLAKR
jgi:acetolactate synthase regulatory subunit